MVLTLPFDCEEFLILFDFLCLALSNKKLDFRLIDLAWVTHHIISAFLCVFFVLLLCKFVSWQRNRSEVITLFLYHHLLPPLPSHTATLSSPSLHDEKFSYNLSPFSLSLGSSLSPFLLLPPMNCFFFSSPKLSPPFPPPLQSFSWGRHYIIHLFVQQVLRHEEFEEGCKASCNGYLHESFLSFKIFFYTTPVLFAPLPPFLLTNFI